MMKQIPDKTVDMVLCDLPYGTTSCKWDSVIPFESLWTQYKRVIKDRRAVVLFGVEPFSSRLRMSNLDWFKYDWIWEKSNSAGFMNAKLKPLTNHEIISIFSNGKTANCNDFNMLYNPQGIIKCNKMTKGNQKGRRGYDNLYDRPSHKKQYFQEWTNYPTTVLHFQNECNAVHPTQKPIALLEYLIRTYSNKNDLILDNTMGSGSTGCACVYTKRSFIGIEREARYFEIAKKRIADAEKDMAFRLDFGEDW